MAIEYELLMKKITASDGAKSSLADFGFVVCEIPWPDAETEDVAVRTWPGEHGEDAYIPQDGLKLKPYDIDVKFCYKGNTDTALDAYKALRDYLIGINGGGAELSIYDPYWKIGRTNVWLKSISDIKAHRSNIDDVLALTAKFRVSNPIKELTLVYVGD